MKVIDKNGKCYSNPNAFPMQDYTNGMIFAAGEAVQVNPTEGIARLVASGALVELVSEDPEPKAPKEPAKPAQEPAKPADPAKP